MISRFEHNVVGFDLDLVVIFVHLSDVPNEVVPDVSVNESSGEARHHVKSCIGPHRGALQRGVGRRVNEVGTQRSQ